jgi:hypothetical protein
MHRSGTSMITQLLKELGLFIGKKLDHHYESFFFQRINIWLLQLSGADWSYPTPFNTLLNHTLLRKQCCEIIRHWLSTRVYLTYLGIWNSVRYRSVFNLPFFWGWKDPRSTITLPIWLDIFPQLKIIHIIRNGVDVANSLSRRSNHILEESSYDPSKKEISRKVYWNSHKGWMKYLHLPIILDSARCLSLQSAFELWEEYMTFADQNLQNLKKKQIIVVRYEDFLTNGVKSLKKICQFIGLSVDAEKIKDLCDENIISNRGYAYKNNFQLKSFYDRICHRDYMRKYGY